MYRITSNPDGKCAEFFTSVYEKTSQGIRGWSVTEFYRKVVAYREANECPTRTEFNKFVVCNPSAGIGAELFERAGTAFSFDDSFDSIEQSVIMSEWKRDEGFLSSRWIIEDEYIKIPRGFKVDLIQHTGDFKFEVIESDLLLCDYVD